MPDKIKYILSQRPRTYWNSSEARLSTARGTFRTFDDDDNLGVEGMFGNFDPILMRGEYLPDYLEGEEEIVRIALNNNEVDTWSVRAREEGGFIQYRVVDEYETEFIYAPTKSHDPLSFEEVISLVDSIRDVTNPNEGITHPYHDFNLHLVENPEEEIEFVTVFSRFYPDLMDWYYDEAREWLASMGFRFPKDT